MKTAIRFLHDWHQFKAGDVVTTLDYGVMDALVNYRRIAEWVEEEVKPEKQKVLRRPSKEPAI